MSLVRADDICRRLMSVPGVGALTALTFKTAVDDPARFTSSKTVGVHFGLTPKKYQSGETDITGAISKTGDEMARTALYEAAQVMLTRTLNQTKGSVHESLPERKSSAFSTLKCRAGRGASTNFLNPLFMSLHQAGRTAVRR